MLDSYSIIICGPQSCGNHLAGEIIKQCMEADELLSSDDPEYPKHLDGEKLIIWGAVPCGKRAGWEWLLDAMWAIQKRERPRLVIPMRSWPAAAKSAVNHLHVADMGAAYENFRRACSTIFRALDACPIPFHILSYEGLHEAWDLELAVLAGFLGVPVPDMRSVPFKYANPERWDEMARGEVGPNGQY